MFGRRRLACSFCGKGAAEVAKLVAGPRVYICDRCVAVARQIMEGTGDEPRQPEPRDGALREVIRRIRGVWERKGRGSSARYVAAH